MVVGEDAKVTGYFFTDFDEANRILSIARTSVQKAISEAKQDKNQSTMNKELINPWKKARVSSVPLDFAVTLASRSMSGQRRNGGSYFQVAPSETNIQDALAITGKDDLAEGKVPLFYMEDLKLKSTGQTPLYFSRKQLEDAYRGERPTEPLQDVKVTELFAVLLEMVRQDGTDTDLQSLVFVPPPGSRKRQKECEKLNGKEAPFLLGERIVVL